MIWRIFVEIKIVAKENISIAINNALCYYTIKSENIKKIINSFSSILLKLLNFLYFYTDLIIILDNNFFV